MSDSLKLHELQHTGLPCPSQWPWVCSNSCPLSRWCHPIISSSVVPFSSHLQSFPALESFQMSQFFTQGFPFGLASKESACSVGDLGSIPGLERFPWRRERLPTLVFWLGEFHAQHSSWDHKELDTTEWLSLSECCRCSVNIYWVND